VVLPTVCSLDVISFRVFYRKGLTTEPNQEQGTQHGSRAVDRGRKQQKSQTSQAKPDAQEPGRQGVKAPRQEQTKLLLTNTQSQRVANVY
jgi:hypothetical protein